MPVYKWRRSLSRLGRDLTAKPKKRFNSQPSRQGLAINLASVFGQKSRPLGLGGNHPAKPRRLVSNNHLAKVWRLTLYSPFFFPPSRLHPTTIAEVISDITEMDAEYGSSWIFSHFRLFHVRFARAAPHNAIRFGLRPKGDCGFNPTIAPLLKQIVDPQQFALIGYHRPEGLCIPISIIITILTQYVGVPVTELTKKRINEGVDTLRFRQLLHPTSGIKLENLRHLEVINTPLPVALTALYPILEQNLFKGLSINVFRAVVGKDPDNPQKPAIYLFPTLLGRHHADSQYLQVDVLLDSPDLRPSHHKQQEAGIKNSPAHVLLIPNLAAFLARGKPGEKHAYRYTHVCRSCCRVFSCLEDMQIHGKTCTPFPTGGRCMKRKSQNKIVTSLFKTNPFTRAREKNGLFFKRSDLFRTLLPLSMCVFDVEALQHDAAGTTTKKPAGAETIHTVFAFSMAHASLYPDNHPLPPSLRLPRGLMYDPSTQSEANFAVSMLKTIREDLRLHTIFLHQALSHDPGKPTYETMTDAEKLAYSLQDSCVFCGRQFGTVYTNPFTKRKVRISKNIDHIHLLKSSQLCRFVSPKYEKKEDMHTKTALIKRFLSTTLPAFFAGLAI